MGIKFHFLGDGEMKYLVGMIDIDHHLHKIEILKSYINFENK